MRVLVTGSRTWTDRERLFAVLDWFHANEDPIEVVIEGCQRGADRMAELWAAVRRIEPEHYPADWDRWKPKEPGRKNPAGAIRNRRMLAEGNPDIVIAFHLDNSPGTADMIELARAADIPTYVIRPTPTAVGNPQPQARCVAVGKTRPDVCRCGHAHSAGSDGEDAGCPCRDGHDFGTWADTKVATIRGRSRLVAPSVAYDEGDEGDL